MLHRRRRGWTQAEFARRLGVGPDTLRAWENDVEGSGAPTPAPAVRATGMTLRELCVLRRQRFGITQTRIAIALDRSSAWVHYAERGSAQGVSDVVDYIMRETST